LGALLLGEIGYMGIQYDKEIMRISILGSIAFIIPPIILPMIYLVYKNENSKSKKTILILYFIFFFAIVIAFGRRVIFFSIILIVISSKFAPNKKVKYRGKFENILISIFASIGLLLLIFWSFKFFFALRLSMISSSDKISFFEEVNNAINLLNNSNSYFESQFLDNIIERPFFTISYLSTLFAAISNHSVLFGKEFVNSLLISIPSSLFPAKMGVIAATPEELVHPLLGMPVFDGTNTILTAGLDDFGIAGFFSYPIILVLYYSLIIKLIKNRIPFPIFYFVAFSLINNIISIESSLSGLISVSIRNLVFLIVIFNVVWIFQPHNIFNKFRSSKRLIITPK
jgi:hypothetical protein